MQAHTSQDERLHHEPLQFNTIFIHHEPLQFNKIFIKLAVHIALHAGFKHLLYDAWCACDEVHALAYSVGNKMVMGQPPILFNSSLC